MYRIYFNESLNIYFYQQKLAIKPDFKLIFTMLGERSTTEIHRNEDSKGVKKLKDDAKIGGRIAGNARKELEKKLGRSVISKDNYLPRRQTGLPANKGKKKLT